MLNLSTRVVTRLGRPDAFYHAPSADFKRLSGSYTPARFSQFASDLRSAQLTVKGNEIPNNRLGPCAEDEFPPISAKTYKGLLEAGKAAFRNGEIGAVILAGGTASRLTKNKIFWEIEGGKTLLQLKLYATIGRAREGGIDIPLYIMTSPATRHDVVKMANELGYEEGIDFMVSDQSMLPVLTPGGEMVGFNERILFAPTGHGAVFPTMQNTGVLDWMAKRGVKYVVQSNIDNPLVALDSQDSNPFLAYVGYHANAEREITAQVSRKEPLFMGGIPLWYKPEEGKRRLAIIETNQIEPKYLEQFNSLLPYFNPLTLIYNLGFLRKFDAARLPVVVIEREDKDPNSGEVILKYVKLETMSGSITMAEPANFLPDTIPGVYREGMFTQLKGLDQLEAWKARLVSRFPDFFKA